MRLIGRLAFASASLVALATPAYAQDPVASSADDSAAIDSEDIIVTARRRDESAQDVPLVVNAVTAETLGKLNIREFQEITTALPGLALSSSANGIGTQATLRGVAYDVNVSGNNGTIEFYLNDAPTSSGILFQTLFDIGQIELLRGPQGTLRGRASPSGSMTITSHRPDLSEVGGYINMTGTTRNAINVNAAFGLPIIQGVLAVRVAGVYEENDGNRVHSTNNGLNPYVKTKGVRASLRFDPTDNLSFNASYLKSVRDARQFDQVESANLATGGALAPGSTLITAGQRLSSEAVPRRFRQDFDVFNWQGDFRFAGQRLSYVGSYNKQRYFSFDPLDKGAFFLNAPLTTYTLLPFPPANGGIVTTAPIPQFAALGTTTNTVSTQETHELRIQSDERLFDMFDYVLGGLILKTNSPTQLVSQAALINLPAFDAFGNPTGPVTPSLILNAPVFRPATTTEKSIFFNLTAHLGERTEISGGLRYIHYKETAALVITDPLSGAVTNVGAAARPQPGEQPEQNMIYSASLKHRFTDSFMAYFSFGTSWRPGSTTNAIIAATNSGGVVTAAPINQFLVVPAETSQSYEIGFKSDWLGRRLRFNASAFLQNFENYAYQAQNIIAATGTNPNTDPAARLVTLSPGLVAGVPVQVKGVEAELSWHSPRFSASAAVTYSMSKIKNGIIPCNDYFPNDGIPDSSGQVPTTAPEVGTANGGGALALCNVNYRAATLAPFTAVLQAEYNAAISGRVDGYIRGLASIFGNSQNDPANAFDDIPAYALVNLYAGIRDPEGRWDVGLFAKNLFDTERVLSRNANAYSVSYTNVTEAFVGRPRGITGVSAYRGISMTPPREFGLNVRYAFDAR